MTRKKGSDPGPLINRASVQIRRTVDQVIFSRWIFLSIFIILIPFFIGVYTLIDPPYGIEEWPEIFILMGIIMFQQVLLLMFSLIYGTSMINEEIESRTITYLFMRGSRRFEVLIYKFIGMHLAISILFIISILLTFLIFSLHTSIDNMIDHKVLFLSLSASVFFGSFAYLGLFSFFGVLFKRPLVAGLIFAFFWEVFMVNLPLNIQQVTVMYYIRSIFLGTDKVRQYIEIGEKASVPGSMLVLFLVGAIFLFLACFIVSNKDVI